MMADVDVMVITGFGSEGPCVDALLAALRGRIADARELALRYRTLLLQAAIGIHVALGAMPFEEHSVERASAFALGDAGAVTTCCAEDLVVHEVFAGRDKGWLDVRGIVTRQGSALDQALVWSELLPLLELEEDTTSEARLRALFETR